MITPSQSEWVPPVVLAPNANGTLQFCIDYWRLHAMEVRDIYPIPRMDGCLDSLRVACVFMTLDCNSGYCQIPVADEDVRKTTYFCHVDTCSFRRKPFGLLNAPASFQRMRDVLLTGFRWRICFVHLDETGLSLKLRKGIFFR